VTSPAYVDDRNRRQILNTGYRAFGEQNGALNSSVGNRELLANSHHQLFVLLFIDGENLQAIPLFPTEEFNAPDLHSGRRIFLARAHTRDSHRY
jgi:hypothetical protein